VPGLGECPQGAITIEERPAPDFDETEAKQHLRTAAPEEHCGCPGAAVRDLGKQPERGTVKAAVGKVVSRLENWPVQLTLVPPSAPFLKNADILLTADCVPFAYAGFHEDFVKGHVLLVACPKLDDFDAHLAKLIQILRTAKPKSMTVVHMEVPCCSGLVFMANKAMKESGVPVSLREVTISVTGEVNQASASGTL